MEEKPKSNRRRRERALKMRAEISESAKASEDSCEESVPRVRTKPPRPRKKNKDPLFEEDVVEGFAFLAFKSYEDLEVRVLAWGQVARPTGRGCCFGSLDTMQGSLVGAAALRRGHRAPVWRCEGQGRSAGEQRTVRRR